VDFLKDLFRGVQEDDLAGGAAELAYRFLFAMFPFFLFFAALSGFMTGWLNISDPTDRLISELERALPSDAASLLDTQLRGVLEGGHGGLLSIGAIAALWAASSATKSVMKWMNRVYNVKEGRPFVRKQLVGLGLTLLGAAGFLVAVPVLVVGQVAGHEIAEALGLSGVWAPIVAWARIPVVLVLLMAAMAVVYWLTPNANVPFKWITPGAVMFAFLWLAATIGFAVYVGNFGNYQATYGAIGGVVILMIWLYITAFVLLLGGKVNATVQARQQQTVENQTDAAAIAQRDLDPTTASERRVHSDRDGARIEGDRRTGTGDAQAADGFDGRTEHAPAGGEPGIGRGAAVATAGALLGAVAVRSINSALREPNGHNGPD
jgi:membrane protein